MILLIEIQCKGWEHNRVNSGLIRQIRMAFPDEGIKLYADLDHIKGIEEFLSRYDMSIESQNVEFFDYHDRNYARANEYAEILGSILAENPDVKHVLLLSCNKGILLAMNGICAAYPDVIFQLVLHGALEEVCHKPAKVKLHQHIYRLLWSVKHGRRHPGYSDEIPMKECIERCASDCCRFISYSPCYSEELEGYLSDSIIRKITFIHLSFYDGPVKKKDNHNGKIRIGIYGQAVNKNAYDIIKEYNDKYDNGSISFEVLASDESDLIELENVTRLGGNEHVSDEELVGYISSFDYILVPYDKNQYKVCSSGIFCDAVSYGIPLLMLDSPHLRYYSKYNIGLIADSVAGIAGEISKLSSNSSTMTSEYKKNEIELKKTALKYNIATLTRLL